MHVLLTRTFTPPAALEYAKIAAVKVEDNVERWIDLWVVFGEDVAGTFVEYIDPDTGQQVPPVLIHIENGQHPLADRGTSLKKCDPCDLWYGLEETCTNCGNPTHPYAGFTRFRNRTPQRPKVLNAFWDALYKFLTDEEVPDPTTGVLRKLIDGTVV